MDNKSEKNFNNDIYNDSAYFEAQPGKMFGRLSQLIPTTFGPSGTQ